jgi:alpha-mannosidase
MHSHSPTQCDEGFWRSIITYKEETMPFNFHNRDRINNLFEEMKEFRYRELHDIEGFSWYSDDGTIGNREPQGTPSEVKTGFRWKGWDQYNWLCTSLVIPEELKDREIIGLFDFGVPEGTGNNSHFESLLYLNGRPYQGVDGNHKEVFLNVAENGLELELKFRVWTGLSGGGFPKDMAMEIERAQFGVLDHPTDDFYFLARNVLETYDLLDQNNEHKEWMLSTLVKAFDFVDYTEPRSEAFYQSIDQAYRYLNGKMDGRGKPDVMVSMLGHTHIDVAWLWRLRHTREKVARSFSTVNRMMDRYDHYTFLQSQAQLYDYIKKDYPDIYEHIKTRVAEGKWEPSGSMWVECDCNLVSGESIVRQILVGKNFFKKEFGYQNEFLWLPDVFGYSWALPQILKKSGVDTFMTTKISWNDTNRLPYDTFLWRGIDGTEIVSHFITTTDQAGSTYYTYNGDSRPYAIKGVWDNYRNKDMNKELLISYGYGDGGGGPSRDMIETIRHINKIPGIPHVQAETATEYFRRLHETIKKNEMGGFLPVWDGELYLEFHRGTYTSQAYNKRMNRRMEFILRDAEMLSVLAGSLSGVPYNKEAILEAWKIVLCHQFHDILPGSSIKEVYEDSHVEYEKALAILDGVLGPVRDGLYSSEEDTFTVWNNSNWKRSSYVIIPEIAQACSFADDKGTVLESRIGDNRALVLVREMEPFSFVTIRKIADLRASGEVQGMDVVQSMNGVQTADRISPAKKELTVNQVSTRFYDVSWNEQGQLTGIYDKEAGREILPAGKAGNVLQIFEDKPRCFDAWELEPTIDRKKEIINNCKEISVGENALGIFVTFTWAYHKSEIRQVMCLYHEKKRIDFKTEADWQERQKLMKVAFPVNIRAVDARFDIQYGNIRRPITRNTSWEAAKFEVVAHKWVDLSETGYGLALLNDCKYGHDVLEDTIRLTLIKSPVDPDYAGDLGHHEFTYAIYPHTEEWYQSDLEKEAFDLNNPLVAARGAGKFCQGSFFTFGSDNIVVDCIKQAENTGEVVIRFHEYTGARGVVPVTSSLPIHSWCESDLMEQPLGAYSEDTIQVEIKPYEIKTLLVKFK